MKLNMHFLLITFALFMPSVVVAEELVVPASGSVCPAPREMKPRFPAQALRDNRNGEVLLETRFDDCGRALDVLVKKSSGRKDLDAAATAAIKESIFSEAEREAAIDGKLERKFAFTVDWNQYYEQVDWPKTHKKPRYIIDEQPVPFESVAVAKSTIKDSEVGAHRPFIIQLRHEFMQVNTPAGSEFWLFLFGKSGEPAVAARYRPVIEAKKPIVKLAVKCELDQKVCSDIQSMLMNGLPFARASK